MTIQIQGERPRPRESYEGWSREELIEEIRKLRKRKKYGIVWDEEKAREQFDGEIEGKLPILKEIKNKAILTDRSKPINALIEGDNYHSLSVLNYTHKNAIDVIYIDPPYNTGNEEFIFNDNIVDRDDAYRHSKWLSFMSRRLRLAKNLLRDTGIIFISIDDNEYAQLKLLSDEILGPTNYLVTLYVQVRYPGKTLVEDSDVQKLIETVLVYGKSSVARLNRETVDYTLDKFAWQVRVKGRPKSIQIGKKKVEIYDKNDYEIIKTKPSKQNFKEIWASGKILDGNSSGRFFRDYLIPRQSVDKLGTLYKVYGIGDDVYGYRYFTGPKKREATKGKYYQGVPKEIFEGTESGERTLPIETFLNFADGFGNCRLEGHVDFRSGKKPIAFLQRLLKLGMVEGRDNSILDFFAGSGSTGHAVLEINKENPTRQHRFILCTNDENNICTAICYPRLENVIKGYRNSEGKRTKGLGGNLKYFRTSFVESEPTDRNKKRLVDESCEMLCLKEDCFDELESGQQFKIFTNGQGRFLGIVFDDAGIEPFKQKVRELDREINVYVFSLDESAREEEFEDIIELVNLKPIPEAILNVYRRIFK